MALTIKKKPNFARATGSPADDTTWEKFEFDFDPRELLVIVRQGSTAELEMSTDGAGADADASFPIPEANQNPMIYSLPNIGTSKLFFRKTGADVEILAFGTY